MPRRTRAEPVEGDTDSLKENSALPNGFKDEPVKKEKIKGEKGKGKAKRVEHEPTDEEPDETQAGDNTDVDADADVDADGDPENVDGTPRSRKRARVNAEGDFVPSTPTTPKREQVATLPRDDDGFIPGSIVRIQLHNFLTYDWVEFRPGPYLNMILGPNGTGKSSIACAICLGLNWPPSILGRANEISSFVKHGKESGYIEIELKGAKGQKNLVIRRNLSAKSKSSTLTLNGKSCTGKEITNRMAKLNVQVGNLCSFLPQDKVSEFAQMTPQQLLRETQRAAGDVHLSNWHDTLITAGKELKNLQDKSNNEQERLKTMQERNSQLERDVQRYQERKRIEKDIAVLKVLIPVNEYHEAKERYQKAKDRQRELHARVRRLKDRNAPAHAKLEQLAVQHKEYEKAREKKKTASRQKFQQMKNKWGENDKLEHDAEDVTNKLDGLKRAEKERVKKIKEIQGHNEKWQKELDNPPQLEDVEAINAEIRKVNRKHSQTTTRMEDLQERQRKNVDSSAAQQANISGALDQLKNLEDERHRKLEKLRAWDRDMADAVVWLRNHQDKFKMEVFEPPMICCTVPDRRYTDAIEACFNQDQLKILVTQCEEDYAALNNYLNDSEQAGLRKGARINIWFRPKVDLSPPPMNEAELKALGFDDYAINKIECPDGLLWFLTREVNLHRTAIGLDASRVDVNAAMEAVSRDGGGAKFIAGRVMNTVSRSRYGKRAAANMTKDLRPARNLVSSTIDPEIKKKLDQTIQEARQALEVINEDANNLAAEEREIRAEEALFKKTFDALDARKKVVNDRKKHLATLAVKIETNKNKLKDLENAPSVEDERAKLKKKLFEISKKRVRIVKEYTQLIRAAIGDQVEATRSGLEFLQVGANKNALEALCQEKDEKYQRALAEFEEADQIFAATKADAKNKRDISLELVRGMDQEFQQQFAKMEMDGSVHDRSVNDLRTELDVQRANLDMISLTNPGVVEQYERRKDEIEALTKTIEEREKVTRRVEREIKNARDRWQPALEQLVASIGKKFSAAFDRIGCAGEIRISPHDDYDKWAIDILVKFRDNEKLQLLTGQRQSGGERSLTTILYLMSLTEEARTPFSLVDEINQGMDQRAERAVHNSLVEVTCKPDSAQYFLITPKLLPDLDYHERMKVLCVNNGEWLPETPGLGNMNRMIENFVQMNRDRTSRDRSSRAS
ncbi:P-loop containing nucleoside triphosphate hydrolase protein [Suillus cothurnatus]|nr:P-loop containing nucleoside triphosphate hydrolase protein [Suillus cothurnatus]